MKIDKSKLKLGLWFTDQEGNVIPQVDDSTPKNASFAYHCWPLEIRTECYEVRPDGGYGNKDRIFTSNAHLCRGTGRLAVAMVNSGDYDLVEALAVLASACERCENVLWNKYLPGEDGYAEGSEEWKRCNTVCDFCREDGEDGLREDDHGGEFPKAEF